MIYIFAQHRSIRQLKEEVKGLKKKIEYIEDTLQDVLCQLKQEIPGPKETKLYNGHTEVELKEMANRLRANINEATKRLLLACFTTDELVNSSVTGKRSVKCGTNNPRPPLDLTRFEMVQRLVMDIDHTKDRKWIIGRIQNLQKVLRVKYKEGPQCKI